MYFIYIVNKIRQEPKEKLLYYKRKITILNKIQNVVKNKRRKIDYKKIIKIKTKEEEKSKWKEK